MITFYKASFQDFSYARNKNISVTQFLLNNQMETQFFLALSEQAFQEYQELQQVL
jgi:hypothetical protein